MGPACPLCAQRLRWEDCDFATPFYCAYCKQPLELSGNYARVIFVGSWMLTAGISYAFGFRSYSLLFVVVAAFYLVWRTVFIIALASSPPTVYPSGPPRWSTLRQGAPDE